MKEGTNTGDPSEGVIVDAADVQNGRNDGEKSDAEKPSRDLQPTPAADAQKGVHETDIDRNAEDEKKMEDAIDAQGKAFVRQKGNDG
jgi:hypothetical protein